MKKTLALFLLLGMYCTSIFSQSERILKTVEYAIGEHDNPDVEGQSLTYTLENGGLRIRGYMLTSCCVSIHSMTCLVSDNSIFLSRIDMPFGCDCDNWHYVDFVIDGIPEGDYEVYLHQYECNLESADYAQVSANAISLVGEKDYSLQCADEQYVITLHTVELGSDTQIEIFDCKGKKVWECTSSDNTLYVPSNIENSFCKIVTSNGVYFIKSMWLL